MPGPLDGDLVPKLTYLSPKTIKRDSTTHGTGLFAREQIAEGETVAVKGGYVMTYEEWLEIEPDVGPVARVQVDTKLVLAPSRRDEYEASMMHLNHSCEPNVGVDGQIVFVAIRDVSPGEELVMDYAMMDDHDEQMQCHCGTPGCRGLVTGKDWKDPALQDRYHGYFSAYLARKISRNASK